MKFLILFLFFSACQWNPMDKEPLPPVQTPSDPSVPLIEPAEVQNPAEDDSGDVDDLGPIFETDPDKPDNVIDFPTDINIHDDEKELDSLEQKIEDWIKDYKRSKKNG